MPQFVTHVVAKTLPSHKTKIARLERNYRDHPRFRQLVGAFNAETGHPGRGELDSLEALDQDVVAGLPALRFFQSPSENVSRLKTKSWVECKSDQKWCSTSRTCENHNQCT